LGGDRRRRPALRDALVDAPELGALGAQPQHEREDGRRSERVDARGALLVGDAHRARARLERCGREIRLVEDARKWSSREAAREPAPARHLVGIGCDRRVLSRGEAPARGERASPRQRVPRVLEVDPIAHEREQAAADRPRCGERVRGERAVERRLERVSLVRVLAQRVGERLGPRARGAPQRRDEGRAIGRRR
jgi:hypothetical protein